MVRSQCPKTALLVFAKSPIVGTVKTRMQPCLSKIDCLNLHKTFVRHTLSKIKRLNYPEIEKSLFLTGSLVEAHRHAVGLGTTRDILIEVQVGKQLGERLINALQRKFSAGFDRVIFIGTDSPLLGIGEIESAIEALSGNEVVIGPATDGGYYLIGFSANIPSILRGIAWGTPLVYQQTVKLMERHGVHWKRLENRSDVDTFEDLKNLYFLMQRTSGMVDGELEQELFEVVSQLVTERTREADEK